MKPDIKEEETLVDLEDLEGEKLRKKEELEGLIDELQSLLRSSRPLEPSGKIDVERQTALMQASIELQAEMKQKRVLIETTLREIQEGMEAIKELRDSLQDVESLGKEELSSKVQAMQEKMIERKKALMEAVQAMELLKEKHSKLVESGH